MDTAEIGTRMASTRIPADFDSMKPSFDSIKHLEDWMSMKESNSNSPTHLIGIELIDSDDEPISEAEIPPDPSRWTLPVIREGAAVALLVCVAPAVAACVAAAGVGTLAMLNSLTDE